MITYDLPAPDAPAEEWGAFAVSIPGWRWPDGMHWAAPGFVASSTGSSPTSNVRQFVRVGFTPIYPDPDHWAWWGWLVRMLGPCEIGYDDTDPTCGPWSVEIPRHFRMGSSIGRAAIAAAAALGRWPGGER